MGQIFDELKRRNVIRVALAYVIASWVLMQVADVMLSFVDAPEWVPKVFLIAVILVFPMVLLFSWAFEITPEGIKKSAEVEQDKSVTALTGRKLDVMTIVMLFIAIGLFTWQGREAPTVNPPATEVTTSAQPVADGSTSIAVLPFVNMSNDADQEYFSDGISEELLNLLAKIPDLRVPARTSSFQFKGRNLNIGEVAQELRVDHVLEGSVRTAGNRVRITAQLIRADTGYHLWSDTFDRELDDIFAIQDEISAAIVAALSDTLQINTAAAPQVVAETTPEAYNLYLLGHHRLQQRTKPDIEAAVLNFEAALAIDPDYAPALSNLALAWHLLSAGPATYGTLPLAETHAKAEPLIERALALNPELPEALGVQGLLLAAYGRNLEALPWFERALALNPSLTDVRNWYASALFDLRRYEEARAELEKSYELDPLSVLALNNLLVDLIDKAEPEQLRPLVARLEQLEPVRAATFESGLLAREGRLGESIIVLLRAADANPDYVRIRAISALRLIRLELYEDALMLWPVRDSMAFITSLTDDVEAYLQHAQREHALAPGEPNAVGNLAWAYFLSDRRDEARMIVQRFLDDVDETVRATHPINRLLVVDAWLREDQATLQSLLPPLLADRQAQLDAGYVGDEELQFDIALYRLADGDIDTAYKHMQKALQNGSPPPFFVQLTYELFRLNDRPRFAALRESLQAFRATQRRIVLAEACGPNGYSIWKPAPETCARYL